MKTNWKSMKYVRMKLKKNIPLKFIYIKSGGTPPPPPNKKAQWRKKEHTWKSNYQTNTIWWVEQVASAWFKMHKSHLHNQLTCLFFYVFSVCDTCTNKFIFFSSVCSTHTNRWSMPPPLGDACASLPTSKLEHNGGKKSTIEKVIIKLTQFDGLSR